MAKHGRRRKFRRYIRGNIDQRFSLGALGIETLVGENNGDSVSESTFISSLKATWAMANFTKAAGDGPILVGVAHSDYSDAEIEAWVELQSGWNVPDLVSRETSARLIRRVGVFDIPIDTGDAVVLNDGRPIHTKLKWSLSSNQTLKFWAYNTGASALTSGTVVLINGFANLWPR